MNVAAKSKNPSNLTGYENPKSTKLLDDAKSNMNYGERMRQFGDIQRIFWDEDPGWLLLFNQVQLIGTRKGLQGLQTYGFEVMHFNNVTKP